MLYKIHLIKTITKTGHLRIHADNEEEAFRIADTTLNKPLNAIPFFEKDTKTITLEFDDLEAEIIR